LLQKNSNLSPKPEPKKTQEQLNENMSGVKEQSLLTVGPASLDQ